MAAICFSGKDDASHSKVNKILAHSGSSIPLIHRLLQRRPATAHRACAMKDTSGKSYSKSTDRVLMIKYLVSVNGSLMF